MVSIVARIRHAEHTDAKAVRVKLRRWLDRRRLNRRVRVPRGRARRLYERVCVVLWRWGWVVWVTIGVQVAGNLASSALVAPPDWLRSLQRTPLGWLLTHPTTAVLAVALLSIVTTAVFIGSHPGVWRRAPDVRRAYLTRVIKEHEQIALTGIPESLVSDSVNLDEIFVEPVFLRRAVAEYPLSAEERAMLRRALDSPSAEEVERILAGIDRRRGGIGGDERYSLGDVLDQFEPEKPILVIQGKPGAGKSTLLARIALNLARRSRGDADPLPTAPQPVAVPIFVQLREYADACANRAPQPISLREFIGTTVAAWSIDGVGDYLDAALRSGACTVLMDGLDEISDIAERKTVQRAIREFTRNYAPAGTRSGRPFNRILITSRLAGYDQHAFPDAAAHVTIADFSIEQIDTFLTQWNHAVGRWDPDLRLTRRTDRPELARQRVTTEIAQLRDLISGRPALLELAGNPLLLALLTVMHHNQVALSLRRSEIFGTIVRTMLESRNTTTQLPVVPEEAAIAKLGPLAVRMQSAHSNNLADRPTVMESVSAATRRYAPAEDASVPAVEAFLHLVRVRGGVFGRRTEEYYGFAHRTFQEYFAARYLVREALLDPQAGITALLTLARDDSGVWREPFVLAMACASDLDGGGPALADRLLGELVDGPGPPAPADVILCAECLVDVRAGTVTRDLQRRICTALLDVYAAAHAAQDWLVCSRVEHAAHGLLLRPQRRTGVLSVFTEVLAATIDSDGPLLQPATALLAMVAGEVAHHAAEALAPLVPTVMTLAGAPPVGAFRPRPGPRPAAPDVQGYCVTVLSLLDAHGPAGADLTRIREQLGAHPTTMEMAGRLSLRLGTLLTPTVAPVRKDASERYRSALDAWRGLLGGTDRAGARVVSAAVEVQRRLLDAADQVRYPLAAMLVEMLERAGPGGTGDEVAACRAYLAERLETGTFLQYRMAAMLWTAILADPGSQEALAALVRRQFTGPPGDRQLFARCWLAMLCDDKRTSSYTDYLERMRTAPRPDRLVPRSAEDFRDLHRLRDLQTLRGLEYTRFARFMTYLGYLRCVRGLHFMRAARVQRPLVVTSAVAARALADLRRCAPDANETWPALDLVGIVREWVTSPARERDEVEPRPAVICEAVGALLAGLDHGELAVSMLSLLEDCLDAEPTLAEFPDRLAPGVRDRHIAEMLLRLADRPDDGLQPR
ncbi:NACHT domain-containing protein [Dactylosporangium vinaceum]|uniref:NACHT domain-containing protein n=1 Tax=Dactylosporangium vinaceum TaxID=53362 RepID=A0ABV5MR34_9ACTN|nr:NACHT domain-containing protein [Dactylosporangium vinaceum]UAC00559.1 NACHT domain-containing protein [Dactylosporangium vinaceum]